MKPNHFLYLFSTILLLSCGSKTNKTEKAAIDVETVEHKPDTLLKTNLQNEILGSWILKDYAQKVSTTLSPFASVSHLEGITEAKISSGDVLIGINNTEAVSQLFLELDEDAILFENGRITKKSADEIIIAYQDKEAVLQRAASHTDIPSVVDYFILQQIIAGTYQLPENDKIMIHPSGLIQAVNIESIRVLSRFDELGDFDLLELTILDGTTTWYAWEIRNKDLWLYNLKPGSSHIYEKDVIWQKWKRIAAASNA